jgi:tetratricopeptide (TPR) repeat protein
VFGLRWRLRSWLVTQADDLIARYRSDTPTIRENQWRTAEALLVRASELREDGPVTARLEYCRAHLHRIAGRADEARAGFERAVASWKSWADPHLGLAHVHAYSQRDPERTREALERAQRAGYRIGPREVAFLADAHRLRAERRWAGRVDAVDPRGRYRLLEKVQEDLDQAREYYESIPDFGDVQRHLRTVGERSLEVERELLALAG